MNRDEIKQLLPHREPMLLVDEMTRDGDSAHSRYTVRGDEWFLQGHFPGNPVVPGVVLCEIIAQGAALLVQDQLKDHIPFFAGMNKVKFRNSARPGDTLEITAQIVRRTGPFVVFLGQATVRGKKAVEGEFTIALVNRDAAAQ
jgi:3-hydroxyacyl-[acyl-carrier-protein] dehydratase